MISYMFYVLFGIMGEMVVVEEESGPTSIVAMLKVI